MANVLQVSNLSGLRNTNNMPTAQETDARIDEMRAKIQELLDNFFRDTGVRFYIRYAQNVQLI